VGVGRNIGQIIGRERLLQLPCIILRPTNLKVDAEWGKVKGIRKFAEHY
jgi:hypothetical protein